MKRMIRAGITCTLCMCQIPGAVMAAGQEQSYDPDSTAQLARRLAQEFPLFEVQLLERAVEDSTSFPPETTLEATPAQSLQAVTKDVEEEVSDGGQIQPLPSSRSSTDRTGMETATLPFQPRNRTEDSIAHRLNSSDTYGGQVTVAPPPEKTASVEPSAEAVSPQVFAKEFSTIKVKTFTASRKASNSLTMHEAVITALKNYPEVEKAVEEVIEQKYRIDGAYSGYLPSVNAGLSSGRTDEGDLYALNVSASQLLYDFGKTQGEVRKNEAELKAKEAELLKAIDDVALETIDTLINVHLYQKLNEITEQKVEAMKGVVDVTHWRRDAGVASKTDILQARTRLEAVEAELLGVQAGLIQWRQKLARYVGDPLPEEVASLNWSGISLDDWTWNPEIDHKMLPEVVAKQASYLSAVEEVAVAKADLFPSLMLESSYRQVLNHDQYMTNPENEYSVMVSTAIPLFKGGETVSRIRSAKHRAAADKADIQTVIEDALLGESMLVEEVDSLESRVVILEKRRKTMHDTSELYRDQYTVGTRSVLDLLNGEEEKFQAITDEETARHELFSSSVKLIAARGLLRQFSGINGTIIRGIKIVQ